MRSALRTRTVVGLVAAAVALMGLAAGSLASFVMGDGGLGMLLCGLFIAGVPLTAAVAIRVGGPWWQLSHEAALLRQREKELYSQVSPVVVPAEAPHRENVVPTGSAELVRSAQYRTARGARYDMPDEVFVPNFASGTAGDVRNSGMSEAEPLPLAEYSALSSSSHVLARVMQDSWARSAQSTGAVRAVDPAPDQGEGVESKATAGGLIAASHPHQLGRGHTLETKPSWWSPTGLNERATQHLLPGAPERSPIGGWGLLFVAGGLLTLFAVGVIAGVLSAG